MSHCAKLSFWVPGCPGGVQNSEVGVSNLPFGIHVARGSSAARHSITKCLLVQQPLVPLTEAISLGKNLAFTALKTKLVQLCRLIVEGEKRGKDVTVLF